MQPVKISKISALVAYVFGAGFALYILKRGHAAGGDKWISQVLEPEIFIDRAVRLTPCLICAFIVATSICILLHCRSCNCDLSLPAAVIYAEVICVLRLELRSASHRLGCLCNLLCLLIAILEVQDNT